MQCRVTQPLESKYQFLKESERSLTAHLLSKHFNVVQNESLLFSKHEIFITAKNALQEPLQLIQLWAQEVFHTYRLCQNGNISKASLKSIDDWSIQIPIG